MIQTLRNKASSWLVKILLLLLVLSFAVWGIGDFFRDAPPDTVVATVGEIEIDLNAFNAEFQRQVAFERQNDDRYTTDDALEDGLVDDVLDRLVNQALLIQLSRNMELVIPDEVVAGQIRVDPRFQSSVTGQFDNQRLLGYLANRGLSEAAFVEEVRREIQQGVLQLSVLRGAWVPATLGDALFEYRQEGRIADVVSIPYATIFDVDEPTEDDLRSFHAENGELFTAPEYRNLTVVAIQAEDYADEIAVSDEELSATYEQRLEQFVADERRQLDQVIVDDQAQAGALAEAARANGSLADALAADDSIDGDIIPLDWSTRSDMFGELADAGFALPSGGISDPIETAFGWHVLQVTGIEAEEVQPLDQVADTLRRDIQIDRALDVVFEQVNALEDELAAGTDLNEAVSVLGLTAVRTPPIAADGSVQYGSDAPDLPNLPAIATVAFDLDEGEASLMEEASDTAYFTARVDGIVPPAVRPFDQVRDEVEAAWRNAERGRGAARQAELVEQRLAAGNDPSEVASAFNGTATSTVALLRDGSNRGDLPQAAIERLFTMHIGDVETVDDGVNQLVIRLDVIELPEPNPDDFAYQSVQANAENAMGTELLRQFFDQLHETIDVEIHQSVLDRQYHQS